MRHSATSFWSLASVCLMLAAACEGPPRSTADSAAGAIASNVGTALAVLDVDMGRHVDAERKVSDKTDDFAPTDTVYASVHMSGTANNRAVVGRWTYGDAVVDEKTDMVTTTGDARTVFYISRPGGLPAGKYTLHVLVDGKEVRAKDVTVK